MTQRHRTSVHGTSQNGTTSTNRDVRETESSISSDITHTDAAASAGQAQREGERERVRASVTALQHDQPARGTSVSVLMCVHLFNLHVRMFQCSALTFCLPSDMGRDAHPCRCASICRAERSSMPTPGGAGEPTPPVHSQYSSSYPSLHAVSLRRPAHRTRCVRGTRAPRIQVRTTNGPQDNPTLRRTSPYGRVGVGVCAHRRRTRHTKASLTPHLTTEYLRRTRCVRGTRAPRIHVRTTNGPQDNPTLRRTSPYARALARRHTPLSMHLCGAPIRACAHTR